MTRFWLNRARILSWSIIASSTSVRKMYSHESLIHSLARKPIDMHWILRILRKIARRFQVHRWESARRSHRNGQLDPPAPHRNTKNSSIANNIRQSNWESIDLGNEKETNAKGKREIWNFSGSHYRRETSIAGQFSPLHASSFFSIGWLFPQSFTPPTVFFPAKMDMFSFDQTPRSPPSGRSEWDDQILLCRRWPVQTMTSWKVSLHGKQDEKYLACFFTRLLFCHKPIGRAGGILSWTCMRSSSEWRTITIARIFC